MLYFLERLNLIQTLTEDDIVAEIIGQLHLELLYEYLSQASCDSRSEASCA